MIRTFYAITRKNEQGKTVYYDYYNDVWLTTIDMDCLFLIKNTAEGVAKERWEKDYYRIATFELKEIEECQV